MDRMTHGRGKVGVIGQIRESGADMADRINIIKILVAEGIGAQMAGRKA